MKKLKNCAAAAAALLLSLTLGVSALATSVVTSAPNADCSFTLKNSSGQELAKLYYSTDSDPENFAINFSTKWENSKFEDAFKDVDAYAYFFVINPSIPSTSIPTLSIINPFVEDGEYTVPSKNIAIYQESNGKLTDVTSSFTKGTDGDDNAVLSIRTRMPGNYIVSEKKIDLAAVNPKTEKSEKPAGSSKKSTASSDGVYLPKMK